MEHGVGRSSEKKCVFNGMQMFSWLLSHQRELNLGSQERLF